MTGEDACAGFGRLLSVEDARSACSPRSPARPEIEVAYLSEALGRVLAEPVVSTTSLPPWDNSAMDGYAIRAADTAARRRTRRSGSRSIGEVAAGRAAGGEVRRGTAVRIATGAPVPPGADAVVPVELTTPLDAAREPAGPRGRDADRPAAGGVPRPRGRPRRRLDPARRQRPRPGA